MEFDNGAVGADWVPQKARAVIYRALGTLFGLELIFDFVSPDVETKVAAVAALFGFGLASVYTPRKS